MKLPLIVVNFKTYKSATGALALELARLHAKVARKTGVTLAVAAQAVDLRMLVEDGGVPVFAQHFDVAVHGAYTGHVMAHALKEAGVYGSLLNHAEKKLPLDILEKSIALARDAGLFTIVCAETPYEGKAVYALGPDMVAVEPPELIGGDISVTTASPQVVLDAVAMIGAGKVLVGAGVKTAEDVRASLKYGASGVLLASGVTKSLDPEKTLMELASGALGL
jgi:triosephosphate isomerase (TIM)